MDNIPLRAWYRRVSMREQVDDLAWMRKNNIRNMPKIMAGR